MVIDIKLFNDRRLEYYEKIIGKTFENEATKLKFYLTKEMKDKDFYLEFETPTGEKFSTLALPINVDEEEITVEYIVPNSLLSEIGELKVEIVIREKIEGETEEDSKTIVFKSYNMIFTILESINATENIPEQFPDVISQLFEEVAENSKKTNNNTEDISKNYERIIELASDISENKADIENLYTTKANQGYVELVENEVKGLEESISEIDKDISNMQNDIETLQQEMSEVVTKSVDDLVNYYKKSETYTQTEVNQLIGAIKTVSMKIVPERPAKGETNIIYLVPSKKTTTENIYDEYIYVNNKWEIIGSTAIDLTNYYTKDEINTLLFDYITSNDLEEALKDYVTIAMKYDFVKDGLINNTNILTDEEKLKIESWLGLSDNYLTYYNATPYQVNSNYIPAHKKYVDDSISSAITRALESDY